MKNMLNLSVDLHDVQITNNEAIGSIPDNAFDGMYLLKRLQLQNIGLLKIPKRLPESIIYLNLAFNKIKDLSVEVRKAFQKMKALQYLDMQYNMLHTFAVQTVQPLHKLQWVHLKGNPLDCECGLWPFVKWVNNRTKLAYHNTEGFFGRCSSPPSQKGTDIRALSTYFKHEKVCVPPNCGWDGTSGVINCSYAMQDKLLDAEPEIHNIPPIPPNSYWKTIDLSSLRLKAANINLTHLTELETVILFNNSMNVIPIEGLPKSVKIIKMANNNITKLPQRDVGLLQHRFKAIDCIDLRNNKIRTISEEDVGYFQHLSSLKLRGNPLICDCKIRPLVSWISANHDIPSSKDHDFQNLLCHGPDEVKGKVIATLKDGDYCPSIKISAVIGGLLAGVMVLVVIFFCSLGYYRKRGKIKEREAILQGFRDLLQQEAEYKDTDPETGIIDNSRIKYDAFLSYSAHDEDADFAAMLSDELEIKHSYKLCIHERDFLPGMGIADNIVECIGASKRIILILSQHFLSSPWCQYEVQIALTELHQKRKSKLLIPILLEDLDENIEGSVKTFLSLIKAIKIPDDNSHTSWAAFWQELLRAMPDDRILDNAG